MFVSVSVFEHCVLCYLRHNMMLGVVETLGAREKVSHGNYQYSFFKDHICHSSSEIKSLIYIICLF